MDERKQIILEEFNKDLEELNKLGVEMKKIRAEMMMISNQMNEKTSSFMQKYYQVTGQELSLGEIIKMVLERK